MELGGITIVTALGILVCPLVMAVVAVGRWLPWRQSAAKLRSANRRSAR